MHGFTISTELNAQLNSLFLLAVAVTTTWLLAKQKEMASRQERQRQDLKETNTTVTGLQNGEGDKKIVGTVKGMITDGLVHPGPAVPVQPKQVSNGADSQGTGQ